MSWFQEAGRSVPLRFSADIVRALLDEQTAHTWRRAVMFLAATELPSSALIPLSKIYEALDGDKDGVVHLTDIEIALVRSGVPTDVAKRAAALADLDASGSIEWSEFVAAVIPSSHELFMASIEAAFNKCDANNDGCLDKIEVAFLLKSGAIGSSSMLADWNLDAIISELDANNDGKISWIEFHDYFVHSIMRNHNPAVDHDDFFPGVRLGGENPWLQFCGDNISLPDLPVSAL